MVLLRFRRRWSFKDAGAKATDATWRYTFTIRPAWLAPVGDRIARVVLGRDIERRLAAFARSCTDPDLIARAEAQLAA